MANLEHVERLLTGTVSAWNQWRMSELVLPDLSGFDISGELRQRSGLDEFSEVYLRGINMIGADLRGAILTRCVLDGSDFRSADLTGADLSMASMVDANFDGAKLEGAYLAFAKCYRGRFSYGGLRGANLFTTPNSGELPQYDPSVGDIQSVSDLITWIKRLDFKMFAKRAASEFPEMVRWTWYFRGHRKWSWELQPSAMRGKPHTNAERDSLTELKSMNPYEFDTGNSLLADLVKAQEFGLPTRLLDVSSNPLVGLFFAVAGGDTEDDGALHVFGVPPYMIKPFNSDTVSLLCAYARLADRDQRMLTGGPEEYRPSDINIDRSVGQDRFRWNEVMDRMIGEVAKEKGYFSDRIDPFDFFKVFLVQPQRSEPRLQRQGGAFLLSAIHARFDRETMLKVVPGFPVYDHFVLTVPAIAKTLILDELAKVGITAENLLYSLEGSAGEIKRRFGFL